MLLSITLDNMKKAFVLYIIYRFNLHPQGEWLLFADFYFIAMEHTFTLSELKAYSLMVSAKRSFLVTGVSIDDIRKEIDEFMLLSEQIKNERSIIAMQNINQSNKWIKQS